MCRYGNFSVFDLLRLWSSVVKIIQENIIITVVVFSFAWSLIFIVGGFYCTAGTTWPSLLCAPGYYCRTGAIKAAPDQGTEANICPEGYYCEEGTAEPTPCPQGTYSNVTGLGNVTQCTDCDPGRLL